MDSIAAQLEQMYTNLKSRVTQLDSELRQMIQQRNWGPEFDKKEAEICKLQAELSRIDSEKQQPSLFTPTQPLPRHTSLNMYPLSTLCPYMGNPMIIPKHSALPTSYFSPLQKHKPQPLCHLPPQQFLNN